MSNVNQGSQVITFDYKLPAKGSSFARLNRNVIRPGIYSGLNITYVGNNVFISTGTIISNCLFGSDDNLQVKVDFESIYNYGITNPTTISENEVLYIEYEYGEVTENYADFKHTSYGSFDFNNKNLIVIGELVYNLSNNINSVYYGNRTYGLTYSDLNYAIPDNTKYYNRIDNTKLFYIDGSLLPSGTRKLNIPNFTESESDFLLTNTSNTTIIKNNLNVSNTLNVTGTTNLVNTNIKGTLNVTGTTTLTNANISDRLTATKFYGRVPIGSVIPVLGVYQSTSNGGTFTSASLPSSGSITDDGFQRCDGAIINNVSSIFNGKYSPDLTGNRFLMGSTSAGTLGGNTNNQITISSSNLPTHTHDISHTHTGSTTSQNTSTTSGHSADHSHGASMWNTTFNDAYFVPGGGSPLRTNNTGGTSNDHTHTYAHTHAISTSTQSTTTSGNGGFSNTAIDIRPLYISVVYLIRVL